MVVVRGHGGAWRREKERGVGKIEKEKSTDFHLVDPFVPLSSNPKNHAFLHCKLAESRSSSSSVSLSKKSLRSKPFNFGSHTCRFEERMTREHPPEPLDFFIWTVEDVGSWLEEINLGGYRQIFKENGVNGEYLESMSVFTTEQILHFIRRHHMKWGDFITLCKELRRIKVACLKGEQRVRRPWWAPSCLSVVFVKAAKRNRQSRVVSLKLES
ncbi:Sterile alpha motif domain [Arabidopsis thaliana x Arabidopsis arenosa]|uniref:Sterile alpha motif domain n=1 Tax=Arabidopsis thaliana x Arabidopsis arenosa TaxID=1240361 RepID=A0A8T2AUE9_9BRAS|nr:Sterile alpha motif domain [Arabidopsis thaliana x Arabidopsis arenosa]